MSNYKYPKNLTGFTFNNLEVIGETDKALEVLCFCGTKFNALRCHLVTGHTKSCGCLRSINVETGILKNIFSAYKSKAIKSRELEWSLSFDDFKEIVTMDCHYCGQPPGAKHYHHNKKNFKMINGIDRVNSDLGYVKSNVVPCCKYCNRAKSDLSVECFEKLIDKIHAKKYYGATKETAIDFSKIWG